MSKAMKAVITNDDEEVTVEFNTDDVMNHHLPGGTSKWDDLCDDNQVAFSQDYGLFLYRKNTGDQGDVHHVEVYCEPDVKA